MAAPCEEAEALEEDGRSCEDEAMRVVVAVAGARQRGRLPAWRAATG